MKNFINLTWFASQREKLKVKAVLNINRKTGFLKYTPSQPKSKMFHLIYVFKKRWHNVPPTKSHYCSCEAQLRGDFTFFSPKSPLFSAENTDFGVRNDGE